MATEYRLPYTANDINVKLGKIDSLAEKSELPTKLSDLTNDKGFATLDYVNAENQWLAQQIKNPLIVTTTVNNGVEIASHTPQHISAYVESDFYVVLKSGTIHMPLCYLDANKACFMTIGDNYFVRSYYIDKDGHCEFHEGYLDDEIRAVIAEYLDNTEIYTDIDKLYDMPHLSTEDVQAMIDEAISNLPVYDGTYREIY